MTIAHQRLIAEAQRLSLESGPYRMTNENVEHERVRFDAAQEFIKKGRLETARRLYWWPKNEDPPDQHWTRVPKNACRCRGGAFAPEGPLGLCGYCGGVTKVTPSLIPVTQIPRA